MVHQLFLVNGNQSLVIKYKEQNTLLNQLLIKVAQLVLFRVLLKKWIYLQILVTLTIPRKKSLR